ncbi:hypothetical protein BO78DRAFT_12730 [Aspergillus sclerotiicarbonarius CBS 121057]|uniref:Uncharacterized protein n=1 Tax=Aspergillus sclerotiicarbonarius (strain CBS 121057 / IBT 28362) TaxID=1448318 RepID=A0A319FLY1_ASPSB|nr:hypothetical protein BO78DRAFT_12730 [Aspergillus sclerotiicarbonarius CBS 121057]
MHPSANGRPPPLRCFTCLVSACATAPPYCIPTCLIFKLRFGYVGHPHWPYHPTRGPWPVGFAWLPSVVVFRVFPRVPWYSFTPPPMPPGVATLWTAPARLASLSGPIPRNPLSGHWARLFWPSPPMQSSSSPPLLSADGPDVDPRGS